MTHARLQPSLSLYVDGAREAPWPWHSPPASLCTASPAVGGPHADLPSPIVCCSPAGPPPRIQRWLGWASPVAGGDGLDAAALPAGAALGPFNLPASWSTGGTYTPPTEQGAQLLA